jgi:hypothetical protein
MTLATTNQNVGSWDTNLGGKPPFMSHERLRIFLMVGGDTNH